jgi:hypothetical protein
MSNNQINRRSTVPTRQIAFARRLLTDADIVLNEKTRSAKTAPRQGSTQPGTSSGVAPRLSVVAQRPPSTGQRLAQAPNPRPQGTPAPRNPVPTDPNIEPPPNTLVQRGESLDERLRKPDPIGTPVGSAIPVSPTPVRGTRDTFLLRVGGGLTVFSKVIRGSGDALLYEVNTQERLSGESGGRAELVFLAQGSPSARSNNPEFYHRNHREHLQAAQATYGDSLAAIFSGTQYNAYGDRRGTIQQTSLSFAVWDKSSIVALGNREPGQKAYFGIDAQGRASTGLTDLNTGPILAGGYKRVEDPNQITKLMQRYPQGFVGIALTDKLRRESEVGISMVGVTAQGKMLVLNTRTRMTYGDAERILRERGAVGPVVLLDSGNSAYATARTSNGGVSYVSERDRSIPFMIGVVVVKTQPIVAPTTPAPATRPSPPDAPASPSSNAPTFTQVPTITMPRVTYGTEGDLTRKLKRTVENRESIFIRGTVVLSNAMAQDRVFYETIRKLKPGETFQATALLGPDNVPATITVTGAPYNAGRRPDGVIGVTVESKFGKVTMYVSVTNVQDPPLNILGYTNALIRSRGGSSGSPPATTRPATQTQDQKRLDILRDTPPVNQDTFFNRLPVSARQSLREANNDLRNGTTPDAGDNNRTGQQAWRDLINKGNPIAFDDGTVIIGPAGRPGFVRVAVRVENKWISTDYSVVSQTSKNKEDGAINIWQDGKGFGTAPSRQSGGVARTGEKPLPPPSEVLKGHTYATAEVVGNQGLFVRDMPSSAKSGLINLNNNLRNSDKVMLPDEGNLTFKEAWVFLRAGKAYSWNYQGTDSRGRKFTGQVVIERNTTAPETYWVAYSDANGKWHKASFSANSKRSNPADGAINLWPAFGKAPSSR